MSDAGAGESYRPKLFHALKANNLLSPSANAGWIQTEYKKAYESCVKDLREQIQPLLPKIRESWDAMFDQKSKFVEAVGKLAGSSNIKQYLWFKEPLFPSYELGTQLDSSMTKAPDDDKAVLVELKNANTLFMQEVVNLNTSLDGLKSSADSARQTHLWNNKTFYGMCSRPETSPKQKCDHNSSECVEHRDDLINQAAAAAGSLGTYEVDKSTCAMTAFWLYKAICMKFNRKSPFMDNGSALPAAYRLRATKAPNKGP